MREYRYVILDPTGNLTALVTDPAEPEDEKSLTRELLKQSEQVAYLETASMPGAVAAIRLMGGEFCGNAAMAAAAWLVRDELKPGQEISLLLEVSGAAEPVLCTVKAAETGYEGTVQMPAIAGIRAETLCGIPFTVVRMEGITHLICEGIRLEKEEAESLLLWIAEQMQEEAVGLLQWDREMQEMRPLVFVRGSESMVWENGCGSGSAAIGALEAFRSGQEKLTTPVRQPGGTIRVTTETENGAVRSVSITGRIRFGNINRIEV